MQQLSWSFHPFGEAGLLVEAQPAALEANYAVQPLQTTRSALERRIAALIDGLAPAPAAPRRVVEIGVRYGGEDGPDLAEVAARLGMEAREVVAAHSAALHHVLMIGFAPGYPYLGGLPERLRLPRRETPRKAVPAGAVAIAAGMTGIYPARLPGGWHLIGRTERRLFDPAAARPCLLDPGDGVRFVALPGGVLP